MKSNREFEWYSEESLIIITHPQGPPKGEPNIVRAVAVDQTRISISWEPGLFPNGPILFYMLQIKESYRGDYLTVKVFSQFQETFGSFFSFRFQVLS